MCEYEEKRKWFVNRMFAPRLSFLTSPVAAFFLLYSEAAGFLCLLQTDYPLLIYGELISPLIRVLIKRWGKAALEELIQRIR